MKEYEPLIVAGPNRTLYKIPKQALDDWNAWVDLTGDNWSPPLYAKEVPDEPIYHAL